MKSIHVRILCALAVVCWATGLILDLVAHVRRETKKLAYLSFAAPRQAQKPQVRSVKDAS